jgi:hypothetical protein
MTQQKAHLFIRLVGSNMQSALGETFSNASRTTNQILCVAASFTNSQYGYLKGTYVTHFL